MHYILVFKYFLMCKAIPYVKGHSVPVFPVEEGICWIWEKRECSPKGNSSSISNSCSVASNRKPGFLLHPKRSLLTCRTKSPAATMASVGFTTTLWCCQRLRFFLLLLYHPLPVLFLLLLLLIFVFVFNGYKVAATPLITGS